MFSSVTGMGELAHLALEPGTDLQRGVFDNLDAKTEQDIPEEYPAETLYRS